MKFKDLAIGQKFKIEEAPQLVLTKTGDDNQIIDCVDQFDQPHFLLDKHDVTPIEEPPFDAA